MAATAGANSAPGLGHSQSMKVEVATSETSGKSLQRLPTRRRRVQERLASLDTNQDGVVSKEELIDFIEETVHREAQFKYLKWASILLLVFTIVLLGAVAGLVAGIVISVKDTKAAEGALADKGNGSTLRTASGGYMQVQLGNDGADSSTAAGRRLLQTGGGNLTISRADVRAACQYLQEGNAAFPMTVANPSSGGTTSVGSMRVLAESNCAALAQGEQVAVEGIVLYQGRFYGVSCAAGATRCTASVVPSTTGESSSGTNTTATGRRLQQTRVTNPDGSVTVTSAPVCTSCNQTTAGCKSGAFSQICVSSTTTEPPPPSPACFSANALAVRSLPAGGEPSMVPLSLLRPGDSVQVVNEDGSLGVSTVYMFPHFETTGSRQFVEVTTAAGQKMRLTEDHFLYIANAPGQPFATRTALPAAKARAGQYVWVAASPMCTASSGAAVPSRIIAVRRVTDVGLVNPFTLTGNIVVDGVAASSYSTMLGSEATMHSFTAAGRALWRRAPWVLHGAHSLRLMQPLSFAVGALAQKGSPFAGIFTNTNAALPPLPLLA